MSQRTYLGTSLLDIAKGCVEDIYKIRAKFSRSDRYYIYTLDKEHTGIKPNECKQNLHMIRAALDVIKPNGYSSLGVGIRRTFDMLNLLRMNNGFENYFMGRYPTQIDQAIIVCITDGGRLTSEAGIINGDLVLPVLLPEVPGHEYTSEPFRWDYRLYSIVLRLPSFISEEVEVPKFIPTDEECPLSSMCEVTGGRAYKITNERMLHQCLESLSQKCHPGVVLHFMKLDENNDTNKSNETQRWHTCKKMIYVKTQAVPGSHWPIPESFWPDEHMNDKLPARTAHPIVCFSTTKMPVPKIMDHFPIDKYELEPSPLTQYILERRDSNFVWHCYVPKSGKSQDYPFGFLRPSADLQSVHLIVLCYNFPALIDLLSNLSDTFKMRINDAWGSKFAHYLGIIPKYYFSPLSRAFERIGLPNLIKQDSIERILPLNLKTGLQRLRQSAKQQYDMEQRMVPVVAKVYLKRHNDLLKRCYTSGGGGDEVRQMEVVRCKRRRLDTRAYLGLSTVDRSLLRCLVTRSIANLQMYCTQNRRPVMDRETIDEQPMAEMGDYNNYKYQTHVASPPLRELHPAPERKDTFGNPFRRKIPSASSSSSAFEADEKFVEEMMCGGGTMASKRGGGGGGSGSISAEMGRSKGALPLNVTYYNWRRTSSSGCSSPSGGGSGVGSAEWTGMAEDEDTSDLVANDSGVALSPATKNGLVSAGSASPVASEYKMVHVHAAMHGHHSEVRDQYMHNKNLTKRIVTILRHPKIDGDQVFRLLTQFHGPCKLQETMMWRCVHQARQFKRRDIEVLIQQYVCHLATMRPADTAASDTSTIDHVTTSTPDTASDAHRHHLLNGHV